ncbi:hypothetical protein KSP35_15805 [Aquihabitans sp. G128]|uniref:hypothetical protein n=1 Tax=Aquihabitans sp. G128 TaxID=2849779 RepID=UPI001C22A9DE|nr:hypothetical protein [Aquihabitans sp. G128]QXC59832.1 hypothetical protein KSP35_15805 [Aquihabitans sp. G128]
MAAPVGTPGPTTSNGMIPAEWPAQAADKIVETISTVRDKTTKPALTAARGLVYGLLAAIVGIVAVIVLLALVVRLYANYVPGNVWPLYAGLALAMIFGGLICLKRANNPPAKDD